MKNNNKKKPQQSIPEPVHLVAVPEPKPAPTPAATEPDEETPVQLAPEETKAKSEESTGKLTPDDARKLMEEYYSTTEKVAALEARKQEILSAMSKSGFVTFGFRGNRVTIACRGGNWFVKGTRAPEVKL